MKARVRYCQKFLMGSRYVIELEILEVEDAAKYPDGIKYALICKDLKSGEHVLMDNHHPKGPHLHINEDEFEYTYSSDEKLIEDFRKLVEENLGVKL